MRNLLLISLVFSLALLAGCGGGGGDVNPINGPDGHNVSSYNPPVTIPATETYQNNGTWKASCMDVLPTTTYQNDSLATWAQQIFNASNVARVSNGKAAMTRSCGLDKIAQAQARDMALRNYFAHMNPEGMQPWDRLAAGTLKDYSWVIDGKAVSDISFNGVAENAAKGYKSAQAVIDGWIVSEGHKHNLLNVDYTHVGTGVYYDPADSELPIHVIQLYVQAR